MRKFTDYPVGATWKCVDKDGRQGWIKLAERMEHIEVWHYGWAWGDGSGSEFDWAPSYALAKKSHRVSGTFKRVK